ncbi:spore cortex biosynthesis protein YabQ [Caldicellulosiruptoraceae bacterium PP1]
MSQMQEQLNNFILSFFCAFPVGILYDIFFFRKIHKMIIRDLYFFIFLSSGSIVLFYLFYKIDYFNITWYMVLALIIGFYVYFTLFSHHFRNILLKIFRFNTFNRK